MVYILQSKLGLFNICMLMDNTIAFDPCREDHEYRKSQIHACTCYRDDMEKYGDKHVYYTNYTVCAK